jgi:hypothetical protein
MSGTVTIRPMSIYLPDGKMVFNSRVEMCEGREFCEKGISVPRSAVGQLIWAVPGVQQMWMNGYSLTLDKSEAFDWSEIIPRVVEILEGLEKCSQS